MIGLLRKDMYVVGWLGLLMLPLALALSLVPRLENMGIIYPAMLAFMVPLMAFAYDERCKWDRYAAMLPYRTEQIVWSKYILSYMYIVLGEATTLLSGLLRSLVRPESVDWMRIIETGAILLVIMLLVVTFGLPALYRFGAEKGRLVLCLILGGGMGGTLAAWGTLEQLEQLPPPGVIAGVVLVAVAANFASVRVSVRFYKKRQNRDYVT